MDKAYAADVVPHVSPKLGSVTANWAGLSVVSSRTQNRAFVEGNVGICFYIKEGWCTDVTVLPKTFSPHQELLFIDCKPFESPREIPSFILASVFIPSAACTSDAER